MRFPAIAAAMLLVTAPAFTQTVSLAEVARREEARRAGPGKKATKVYTNADLAPATAERPASAPSTGGFESVSTGAKVSADEIIARSVEQVGDTAEIKENEGTWRARAAGFRSRLDAARKDLAAVDLPSPSSDPREQRKLDDLRQRAERRLEQAEKAWGLFEIEASLARIPKDWITQPQ